MCLECPARQGGCISDGAEGNRPALLRQASSHTSHCGDKFWSADALEVSLHSLCSEILEELVFGKSRPCYHQALDDLPIDVPHRGQQHLHVTAQAGHCTGSLKSCMIIGKLWQPVWGKRMGTVVPSPVLTIRHLNSSR